MMARRLRNFLRNERGAAAVEFALVLPLAVVMLLGALNFGIYLFFQNSLSAALDETARSATIWPVPSDTQLQTRFTGNLLSSQSFGTASLAIAHGADASGRKYIDFTATGGIPVNLIFFNMGTIPVRLQKRSFEQL